MKKITLAASITGALGAGLIVYLINRMKTSARLNRISENASVL
jgi:acyl-CoA synthetase (AMP-forming)/AMP-acid ligase II